MNSNTLEKISSSSFENNINSNNNKNSSFIRRTISADMSSPKWLKNNGFPMKRIQSSENVNELGENNQCEEMNEKKSGHGSGGAAFEDIWSSIFSKKEETTQEGSSLAPYVHPLVKRASSLSEKSLEICTESLGSETGSDGFSYPPSDHSQDDVSGDEVAEEKENQEVISKSDFVEVCNKYSFMVSSKKKISSNGAVRSFPPPLASFGNRDDGSNLEMRTRRVDGRLVLEAVSVPSRNCFRALREDGRLLLTLANENEEEFFDDDDEEEEIVEDEIKVSEDLGRNNVVDKVLELELELALVVEEKSCLPMTRMINVDKPSSEMIMTKLVELTRTRNMSTWPRSSNRAVITSLDEGGDDVAQKQVELVESGPARQKTMAKSLPPRPRMSTAKSTADVLNTYEYYWRSPTARAVAVFKPLAEKQNYNDSVPQVMVKDTKNGINKYFIENNLKGSPIEDEVVLVKAATVGETAYLVPLVRGCKEPKRSLFFWEPFCIATS